MNCPGWLSERWSRVLRHGSIMRYPWLVSSRSACPIPTSANRMQLAKGILLYLVYLQHFRKIQWLTWMRLVHLGCVWRYWTHVPRLSSLLAFVTLPSLQGLILGLSSGICLLLVCAMVSHQSFLSLNLILEISYVFSLGSFTFHLVMSPKRMLPALIPLSFTVCWLVGTVNPFC